MKPILYNINAFDAVESGSFAFSWNGNQVFQNQLIVRKNDTNEVVYNANEETLQLKHTLPANTLINGILYNASVIVYDKDGNPSEASDEILFYCYTQPTFVFSNLNANQIIQNSNYTAQLSYSQPEGEELESYQIILYDSNKTVIYSSSLRYDTNNLSIQITGLSDNTLYYAQATGQTLNDMYVDTGLIPFNVDYITPITYATLILENNKDMGAILIRSNIISVEFKSSVDPAIFVDNEYVDLRDSDRYIYLDEAISIPSDFSLIVKGKSFSYNTPIVYMSDGVNELTVTLRKGTFESQGGEKAYLWLECSTSMIYQISSEYFDVPTDDTLISFVIQHQNGLYNLLLAN